MYWLLIEAAGAQAVDVSSITLTADVQGSTQTCYILQNIIHPN